MLSLLACKFCLKLIGKIAALAHLVIFNCRKMESEKTFETTTASTTTESSEQAHSAPSSSGKAPSSAAPIGIYIVLFFIVVDMK